STLFCQRCESEWFPALRTRYPLPAPGDTSPDAEIIRLIHAGRPMSDEFELYPAHLHLDLLPIAQGEGWGTRLMELFLNRLRMLGVPGVHLSVGTENDRAIRFYEKMGFREINREKRSLTMARKL